MSFCIAYSLLACLCIHGLLLALFAACLHVSLLIYSMSALALIWGMAPTLHKISHPPQIKYHNEFIHTPRQEIP